MYRTAALRRVMLVAAVFVSGVDVGAQPSTVVQREVSDLKAAFDSADADHNGVLSKAEASASPTVAGRFESLDTDGDGVLTLQEFSAAANS